MPKCIKDETKSYKGDEPSPKGLGYCAHSEDIGTIKTGRDGNEWIISKTSKNVKRWIKYDKKDSKTMDSSKILLTQNNEYYKEIKKKYIGYKTYFIHDNGGRPYLVYIKNKNVIIYNIPEDKINDSLYDEKKNNNNKWMYINLVEKYKAKEIFIGKSPLIRMTDFSGGHGKYFDGNTILLFLSNNNYVYISNSIEKIKIDDKIEKYYSFVGNSDVPYPMAIGKKNIYFFGFPSGYLPITEFPKFKSDKNLQEIWDKGSELDPFLISFEGSYIKKPTISLEEFKKIKNKSLDEISLQEIKDLAKMFHVTTSGNKKELVDRIEKLRDVIIYKK